MPIDASTYTECEGGEHAYCQWSAQCSLRLRLANLSPKLDKEPMSGFAGVRRDPLDTSSAMLVVRCLRTLVTTSLVFPSAVIAELC